MSTLPSSSAYFFYANLEKGGEEMAEINELSIKVSADVKRASDSLRNLNVVLTNLGRSLSSVNNGQLSLLATNLNALSNSAAKLSSIKKTDFNKLVNSINALGKINSGRIKDVTKAMGQVTTVVNSLDTSRFESVSSDIGNLGVGIRSLGYKTTASAIQNLPQLTIQLQSLFNTMSSVPEVKQNTIDFVKALTNLAAQGRSAGAATRSLNNALNQQNKTTQNVKNTTKSLASTIGKLYATYFWITRLTSAMFKFTDSAMDTYEALNYFNVAIDKVASSAMNEWKEAGYSSADSYYDSFSDRLSGLLGQMTGYSTDNRTLTMLNAKSLGMNISELTQASASFLQIADSIGMTGESALNTSKALSMLSADWSSLRNISTSDAMQKMESALVGQSRAVRSLGVDITVASLQEEAYRLGVTKSVSVMTQQEKSLLRVITMLKKSKVAYGDLAKTIDSPANQVRMLQAAMANLARTIGSLVMPVLSAILPYITGFTIAINRALVAIGNFLGVDWSQNITSLKGGSDALGDLEDSIDDVTGAAEKMNKSTRGWDELNNLTTSKGSGGAGGADETGLLNGALAEALAEYEKKWNEAFENMESKAQSIANVLTRLGENPVFQVLMAGAIAFGATLVGGSVMGSISKFIEKIGAIPDSKTVSLSVKIGLATAAAVGGFKLGNYLYEQWSGENAIEWSLADWWNALKSGEVWEEITNPKSWEEMWNGLTQSNPQKEAKVASTFAGLGSLLAGTTIAGFSKDFSLGTALSPKMDLATVFGAGNLAEKVSTVGIGIGSSILAALVGYWVGSNLIRGISVNGKTIGDRLDELAEDIAPYFTKEKWDSIFKGIKDSWLAKWEEIKEYWNNTWFVKMWNTIKKKFSFSNMQTAFQNIKDGFKDAWQKAVDGAKAIWNKFAEWLNNKLTFTIPPLEMFGEQIVEGKTIKLANIPTFSTGGFPEDGLFYANHNELVGQFGNGQTAVVNNPQIIEGIKKGVYEAVSAAMDGNGGIKVEIDGKEVFSVVQKQSRNYKRMTGVPAF